MNKTNFLLLSIISTILIFNSCSNSNSDKKEAQKEYLRNQAISEVQAAPVIEESHSENITIITDQNFQTTIADGVTLIDFWATWCKPCKMQGPIVDQIADEFKGKATIGKLDVDKNPFISQNFNVASIPTIMIFKDGVQVERTVGLQSKEALLRLLNKYIEN